MSATAETQDFPASVPENFEMALHLTRSELDHHLRLMAALKTFELGQVSSGKAAELAGMSRVDFLHTCGRYKVSVFNVPPDEAAEEIRRELEAFAGSSDR
jgi:predicted HTH domain antitoxin